MSATSMSANDLPEECREAIETIQKHFSGGLLYIPKTSKTATTAERNRRMVAMKRAGVPVTTIAETFGLSRERVHKILAQLRDLGVK